MIWNEGQDSFGDITGSAEWMAGREGGSACTERYLCSDRCWERGIGVSSYFPDACVSLHVGLLGMVPATFEEA